MDKIRIKQAQALIKESGKALKTVQRFKEPEEGKINSQLIADILNQLIESDELVYSSRPLHELTKNEAETFCNQLIAVRNNIDSLLSDFGVIELENLEDNVKKVSENFIFLTTKGTFKKFLVKWGVDPQRIVVAGVPLQIEDMKILNPKIPDNALEPVKKKIKRVTNDIKRKKDVFKTEEVLVVVEDDAAGKILAKRAEKLYNARTMLNKNFKEMEIDEFLKMLIIN
jgi:hypothetical protein